jgi:alkylation response protein AidB-like acyl-CoA dehydrogenase
MTSVHPRSETTGAVPADQPPGFSTPEKRENYTTERYLGATGLNFYLCDPSLQLLLRYYMSEEDLEWSQPYLERYGALTGGPISERAEITDKNPPKLIKYDKWGNDISEVQLPESILATKRDLREQGFLAVSRSEEAAKHGGVPRMLGAAFSYMLHQAEIGMACATGMTGGVASLVDKYAPPEIRDWVFPKLLSEEWDGAMLMTERTGGSDIGAIETTATPDGDAYRLNGFKWFASNADGKAYVTLAKPEGASDSIKGVGLFLVLKERRDGTPNGVRLRQLKDKLGTKAVPSAEVEFVDAEAFLLGRGASGEGDGTRGVARMMEMVTDSRIGVASMGLGCARRALVESICYARARNAFGRRLIDQPLMRHKLTDMIVDLEASQAMVFDAYGIPNRARQRRAEGRLRLGVPLAKLRAARLGVTMASDAIEIHGGNGYVETWPVARILRDAQINPIWEGTDHILYLDVRRAIEKENADEALIERLREAVDGCEERVPAGRLVQESIVELEKAIAAWKRLDRETAEGRLGMLSTLMSDALAGALLVAQADWEQRELGTQRKELVARLFARRYLGRQALQGIEVDDSAEKRFFDLLDGAFVDDRTAASPK